MTATGISASLGLAQMDSRARHIRFWMAVLGLAVADGLSFAVTHFLIRAGGMVPQILVMRGGSAGHAPIDVFQLLAIAFIVVRYLAGDYGRRQLFWDGAKVTTIAILVTMLPDLAMLALGRGLYSAPRVMGSWALLIFLVPVMRQGARVLMSRLGIWQIPTVMIGAGPRTEEIWDALSHSLSLGFDVRWLVLENRDSEPPAAMAALRTVHSADVTRTAHVMRNAGCKQAIVAAEDIQSAHFAEIAQRLLEVNIPVAIIPAFTRLPLANATTNYFFGRDILMLQVRSNVQRLPWRIIKRGFDLVFSIILVVLSLPFFLVLAIAIKQTPGPVFYRQTRIGRRGRPFQCIKLRTMVSNADEVLRRWSLDNPQLHAEFSITYKLKDDPRITPIGRWLRRTSLDELPQLWNVLRGDMSLVGPRPVVAQELEDYYGPAAQLYMRTRPGITGLWQVSGRSDTSYARRVILDEWYILNWSFWYDIVILVQTAWIVITGKGAF